MRRFIKLALTCLAAGAVGACEVDTVIETENIPTAGVRFINAVPDTGAMDFRFVDMVENTSHWNIAYRNNPSTTALETNSLQVQYKNARATSTPRTFKIFMTSTNPAVASDEVMSAAQTITLTAGAKYTILLWGYANPTGPGRPAGAPAMDIEVIDENVVVPAGQVALRVINASITPVTASFFTNPAAPTGGSTVGAAPAGTVIQANLAGMTIGTYVNTTPGTLRFKLEPPGGPAGQLWANQIAMIGSAPTISGTACNPTTQQCDLEGAPGTTQAGSAITAIVFPAAVSPASNTGMTITTGNTPQRVSLGGNYAAPRDYLADGFFVGQEINVTGFTNAANNGAAQITGIRARATSGTAQLSVDATAGTITRTTGSFVTGGFAAGMEITASGFTNAGNNGRYAVTGVTATTLTVTKLTGTAMVTEAAGTGRNVISDGEITVNKVLVTEAFPTTNRNITGTRGRLMSFMWDARPPRPAGT